MKIQYSKRFVKNFQKRLPKNSSLEERFRQRLALFIEDKSNPVLGDHKLTGKLKSFRAFSIRGDFRVVYYPESRDEIIFLDIGTHNQVYS